MVTTGPRVDVVEDHSTFFRCYAFLADSSYAFPEQLSSYHSKGFGSTDDLSSLFFILWEFFPKNVCNVRHCPVGSNGQNLHDQVDHGGDLDFSRVCGALRPRGLCSKRIFLNCQRVNMLQKHIAGNGFSLGAYLCQIICCLIFQSGDVMKL